MKFLRDEMPNLPKAWSFETCPDDFKEEFEKGGGLEKGKWYCEGWPTALEVPTCPFCGAVSWDDRACDHLVLVYDTDSKEYLRLADGLDIPEYSVDDNEDILSEEKFLQSHLPGLKTFESAHCEWSTIIWGFLG